MMLVFNLVITVLLLVTVTLLSLNYRVSRRTYKKEKHVVDQLDALDAAVSDLQAKQLVEADNISKVVVDLTDIAAELNALQAGGVPVDPVRLAAITQRVADTAGRLTASTDALSKVLTDVPDPGPQGQAPTPAPTPTPGT